MNRAENFLRNKLSVTDETHSIEYKGKISTVRLIEILSSLVDALTKNQDDKTPVYISQNNQVLTFNPGSIMKLKISAKSKDEKESLKFKIEWEKPGSVSIEHLSPDELRNRFRDELFDENFEHAIHTGELIASKYPDHAMTRQFIEIRENLLLKLEKNQNGATIQIKSLPA